MDWIKLTAASAQSVRLVVALSETGGSLRYNSNLVSANPLCFDRCIRDRGCNVLILN
jgi:hypothetical protein